LKKQGYKLNQQWAEAAIELGWCDYIYSDQMYYIPRIWFHEMADYLSYGCNNKVRYYYAEAYLTEHWCEGPKLYLTLKLLWNPNLDAC